MTSTWRGTEAGRGLNRAAAATLAGQTRRRPSRQTNPPGSSATDQQRDTRPSIRWETCPGLLAEHQSKSASAASSQYWISALEYTATLAASPRLSRRARRTSSQLSSIVTFSTGAK